MAFHLPCVLVRDGRPFALAASPNTSKEEAWLKEREATDFLTW
ncbi:hypothetical protein FHS90_004602 [Rufibacter quisquiliarum]|uniref:Uncharacterized protein n=1 Tax=Rufibacter quisquiliarum TaxID=1549639 RepID=A0A839H1U9_9BACT|nr:hypothetical protein [Rufibacter quisquiliarum]